MKWSRLLIECWYWVPFVVGPKVKVNDFCLSMYFTCSCENVGMWILKYWMYGKSWLTMIFTPAFSAHKAGHPVYFLLLLLSYMDLQCAPRGGGQTSTSFCTHARFMWEGCIFLCLEIARRAHNKTLTVSLAEHSAIYLNEQLANIIRGLSRARRVSDQTSDTS